jgi:uncharacterized membrane protein
LLVKVAGADVFAGKVMVVVMMPGAGPVPLFVMVMGTSLAWFAVNGVIGCPITVVKSGTPAVATTVALTEQVPVPCADVIVKACVRATPPPS